jgi:archaellin
MTTLNNQETIQLLTMISGCSSRVERYKETHYVYAKNTLSKAIDCLAIAISDESGNLNVEMAVTICQIIFTLKDNRFIHGFGFLSSIPLDNTSDIEARLRELFSKMLRLDVTVQIDHNYLTIEATNYFKTLPKLV